MSRQREWQKKQIALGGCMVCGDRAAKTNRGTVAQWCPLHQTKWRAYHREYQRSRREGTSK